MTDTEKIKECYDLPRVYAKWERMSYNQKHEFLKQVTTTDEASLLKLARKIRRTVKCEDTTRANTIG